MWVAQHEFWKNSINIIQKALIQLYLFYSFFQATKKCSAKQELRFSLQYSITNNVLFIVLSPPDDFSSLLIKDYSTIMLDDVKPALNYSISRLNVGKLAITLQSSRAIVGNPTLKLTLEQDLIPKTLLSSNSKYFYPESSASIVLKEFYFFTSIESQNINDLTLRMNQALMGVKAMMTLAMVFLTAGGKGDLLFNNRKKFLIFLISRGFRNIML
jgi:hypothetical protein